MRLVYIEPVYPQLLEGNHIILACGILQFLQAGFQSFFGTFQRFDGKSLRIAGSQFRNAVLNFFNLFLKKL